MDEKSRTPESGSGPRRLLRLKDMAEELGISDRKFRELKTMGMPFIQVQGIILFDREKVYQWFNKFSRTGTSGVRYYKRHAEN